ncbi:hypothetical protein [Myxococcus xanthus]|uniref:Uncharacterized protein n=1 Tax=Myxococcus xanthus TaxID=34 RepID=A0A7Y4MSC7_MYXXA|nr:hypothetical protein [Myxococcus xanthus]NOJ80385.1 hypothetical protein [Myxococcus xanthus]NOJ84918.1 hypothetical protein [Myxococcus xanthus]
MSMPRSLAFAALFALASAAFPVFAEEAPAQTKPAAPVKCEHGVKKSLCTRCNPKLEAVFKAKGDWCEEHRRPESQCAVCNSKLAKEGVK